MLNQTVLVGRLVEKPTITKEEGKEITYITLAVPRSYKNADGVYDTDFIDAVLYNQVATNTCEYCNKGDLVGIKGRLQTDNITNEDGSTRKITRLIAEKLTFLTSNANKVQEEIDNK